MRHDDTGLDVDEAWIADWAAEGIAALERSLATSVLDSEDGDGDNRPEP